MGLARRGREKGGRERGETERESEERGVRDNPSGPLPLSNHIQREGKGQRGGLGFDSLYFVVVMLFCFEADVVMGFIAFVCFFGYYYFLLVFLNYIVVGLFLFRVLSTIFFRSILSYSFVLLLFLSSLLFCLF